VFINNYKYALHVSDAILLKFQCIFSRLHGVPFQKIVPLKLIVSDLVKEFPTVCNLSWNPKVSERDLETRLFWSHPEPSARHEDCVLVGCDASTSGFEEPAAFILMAEDAVTQIRPKRWKFTVESVTEHFGRLICR